MLEDLKPCQAWGRPQYQCQVAAKGITMVVLESTSHDPTARRQPYADHADRNDRADRTLRDGISLAVIAGPEPGGGAVCAGCDSGRDL